MLVKVRPHSNKFLSWSLQTIWTKRLRHQLHGVRQCPWSKQINIFQNTFCTFWVPNWCECLQLCPGAGRWAWIPTIPHPSMSGVQMLHNRLWTLSGNDGLPLLLEDCRCLLAHVYQVRQWDVGCGGSPHVWKKPELMLTLQGLATVKQYMWHFSANGCLMRLFYKPFFLQRSVKEKRYTKRKKVFCVKIVCEFFLFFCFSERVVLLRCISDYSSITKLARCISGWDITHLTS